jgi:MtaA/CmuA family methyltransferase
MNGRERVLAKIEGRPADCLPCMPITMMFAADRAKVKYLDYCTYSEAQAEAQVRVASEFDFDYVSVISDPCCEVADLGGAVKWYDNDPPGVDEANALLARKEKLADLRCPDPAAPGRMRNRVQAVASLKSRCGHEKLVEGWIEGPCAEAADLRGLNRLMLDFYDDPEFVRKLMALVVELELRFAQAQVEVGADIIGVGDAAASLVSAPLYEEVIWPFEKRLVDGLHSLGTRVRLHICGDTRHIQAGMGRLGCEIVDLDFLGTMAEGRSKMGPQQVLLGNLDPVRTLRNGTPESVDQAVAECHRQAGEQFIVGAGCEVTRDTPEANLRALVRYAKEAK